MKRNRLMYALPLACLLATGAFSRVALADDTSSDPTYGSSRDRSMNADPSRPADNMSPSRSESSSTYDRSERSSSSGQAMKDAAITAKVKSALLAERGLPSSQIKVETTDGTVQLSGFLNSQAEIDRAVSVAKNVKDVKQVENNMQTK